MTAREFEILIQKYEEQALKTGKQRPITEQEKETAVNNNDGELGDQQNINKNEVDNETAEELKKEFENNITMLSHPCWLLKSTVSCVLE